MISSEEPAFKIKTGTLPVLMLHLLSTDMGALRQQLAQRLSQTPDFFTSTPIALELSAIADSGKSLNYAELASFMLAHGMCAAGVVGGSDEQRAAAVRAGLGLFPAVSSRNAAKRQDEVPPVAEPAPVVQPVAVMPPPQPIVRPTLVIDKPVRTGQRIYAEGANLVVLASVNAGAELIADGDIHVYAPMRGKAIAGARDNDAARIFVQGLEAELLAIAGCFKVFEDGIPEQVRAKPAQIYLDGSRLVILPLSA